MNLQDIEAFVAVAETGSVSRAALRLNLTQPATSFVANTGTQPVTGLAVGASTTRTFNWNTTGQLAGAYHYTVWARDSSSAGTGSNSLGTFDTYSPSTLYTLTSTPCTSATGSSCPTPA